MSETLTFDQVHLGAPDPEGAARWYVQHLGATPGDHADRVMFGATRFIFLKNDAPAPSHGAAIDHVGFSFADVGAKVHSLQAAGVRVTGSTFIEDPWRARIELVEDRETIGFHHVHLQVPDPDRARDWYVGMFGGVAEALHGGLKGLRYQDVRIVMDRGAAAASAGHTIDHIGWRMPDLLAKAAALKNRGVRFTTEPHPGPQAPHAPLLMSFMEDPWGVKIELLQRK